MIEYGPIKMNRKEKKYLSQARMSASLVTDKFDKTRLSFHDYLTRPNHPTPETRGFYFDSGDSEEFVITHHKELTNW